MLYRGVSDEDDLETYFRRLFNSHDWGGDWAMGIYGYHHFHSNAHEVLGIAAGSATLVLGGEDGRTLEVRAGDVLIIPTGTGHRRIKDSWDFWVVGAILAARKITTSTRTNACAQTVLFDFVQSRFPAMILSMEMRVSCFGSGKDRPRLDNPTALHLHANI